MGTTKPSLPKGTRDFGTLQMNRRNFIFDTIREVFTKHGFQPIETPAMENLSVLMGKYGEEGDQLLFKILNSGDYLAEVKEEDFRQGAKKMLPKIAEKGLRYDLTVPFARYVVMNRHEITFPFKRYQIQPVWRADRPQKGRYREFYQCDADVIGTNSLLCEVEIISMITETLQKLSICDYTIKINHRKILAGIAEKIGASGKEGDLCATIDKLEKIGKENVQKELLARGFSSQTLEALEPVLQFFGDNSEKLSFLTSFFGDSAIGKIGISEMRTILEWSEWAGLPLQHVQLDLTLARGLTYYTGTIFEVKVNNVQIGSISGGGRYDNLTGTFGLEGVSGVGFSFGVDRLYDVMNELNLFPETVQKTTEVLFTQFDEASFRYLLPLMYAVRKIGKSAEMYPDAVKLKKQLDYANTKRVQWVVLAGGNEIAENKVTLKNMTSGNQIQLFAHELVTFLETH
ncbi:MAG: histidine--tRNA ligase [Cytophagales bacterium]|nr:histidine--tRNA ligase [Cytophagales bacterium]MDW8384294.1 histidine--tRNA ligase [Flammeovirgaceae bacterium]